MTKKRTLFNLNIDDFDSVVSSYTESLNGYQFTKENKTNQIIYRFKKTSVSKICSILTCYISQARVSFYADGKEKTIAETCMNLLIEQTEIIVGENRTFSVKPVTVEDLDTVCDFLCDICNCVKEIIENSNTTIHSCFRVTGKYNDSIRFTFYNNGTLLVQGRPCMTFNNFIEIASDLFNPAVVKREHLKLFDVSECDNVIDSNLSEHLPNAYEHIGTKLDAIMAPSLILLNNAKEMSDYSACAFPVLRGSEGVLKSIFNNEGLLLKDFGEYFIFDRSVQRCVWAKDCSGLFPNVEFRKSLLDLYSFYHAQRHSTFHIDATIVSSRTLKYDEAVAVVKDGLKLINEVYINFN